jgi:tetratricopeptide (TPR) repeat protein
LGDLDRDIQTLEAWKRTYPRDASPYINLAVTYNYSLPRFDRAIELATEAMRLEPNGHWPYDNLAAAHLGLNRFDEAKAVAEKAVALKVDSTNMHVLLFNIAFVNGDAPGMARQLEWAKGKPGESMILAAKAGSAAFGGRLREARTAWREAVEVTRRNKLPEAIAYQDACQAVVESALGNATPAREAADRAVATSRGRWVLPTAALALAWIGEPTRAQPLVEELKKRFPEDTLLKAVYLPLVEAGIETGRGAPAKAIAALEPARPYELGGFDFWPIYARGQAYLRAKAGPEASAEFQKILDHRGVGLTSPFCALAQLGLARAAALSADTVKSRRAYQDFLALWKDADPDVPILKEAKAEYARLQ